MGAILAVQGATWGLAIGLGLYILLESQLVKPKKFCRTLKPTKLNLNKKPENWQTCLTAEKGDYCKLIICAKRLGKLSQLCLPMV